MSHNLTQLNINHNSYVDINTLYSLISEGETEVSDREEKIEELQNEISDLQDEIKDINGDQENALPYDKNVNQSVIDVKENEVELKESEIEKIEAEKKEWQNDIDHIQEVVTELENYGAQNLIRDLDSYIKEMIRDTHETDNLPELIGNNIDWDGIVEDCRNDYSEITLDGKEYYYV